MGPLLFLWLGERVLELAGDPVALCAAFVDVPSVSGDEAGLADLVEDGAPRSRRRTWRCCAPATPCWRAPRSAGSGGCCSPGTSTPCRWPTTCRAAATATCCTAAAPSDMKAGDAVFAHVAATTPEPRHDLTVVFYDCEEVEAARNGLGRIEREHRDWLDADLAILGEPTSGAVEAGCQGTLRVEVRTRGRRAHSARSWLGDERDPRRGDVLERLRRVPRPRGRDRRLRLPRGPAGGADRGRGGGQRRAGRMRRHRQLPLRARPRRRGRRAARARGLRRARRRGHRLRARAPCPACTPRRRRSSSPSTGEAATAKYGWTDVARFAALGIPAVNYGPGDPNLAHTREEHVDVRRIVDAVAVLRRFLT